MLEAQKNYIEKRLLEEFAKPLPRSISDLALELGLKDNTNLLHYIKKLINAGLIVKIKKGKYKTILDKNTENANFFEIPFYGKARCGDGGKFLDDYPEYYIPMNTQLLKKSPKGLLALEAVGDSMEPSIKEGDTVIAEKHDQSNPDKNSFYVVCNDNEVLIKKVALKGKEGFLMSTNPDHLPIAINTGSFSIAGKVVGVYKSF